MAKQNNWFRAKRYGWGWFPCSWQGWLTLAVYLILEIKLAYIYKLRLTDPLFNQTVSTVIFIILTAILTGSLIFVCYRKGESPSWHWGASTKPTKQTKKSPKKKSS